MVLDLFWSSAIMNTSPWATSRMIAATVMGADTIESSGFSLGVVAVALITHYALGILFGIVLVAVSAPLRLDASVRIPLLTGAVFGAMLYLFNFYGMAFLFPWFAQMRGWAAVAAHLIFGMSTAVLYAKLQRSGQGSRDVAASG